MERKRRKKKKENQIKCTWIEKDRREWQNMGQNCERSGKIEGGREGGGRETEVGGKQDLQKVDGAQQPRLLISKMGR